LVAKLSQHAGILHSAPQTPSRISSSPDSVGVNDGFLERDGFGLREAGRLSRRDGGCGLGQAAALHAIGHAGARGAHVGVPRKCVALLGHRLAATSANPRFHALSQTFSQSPEDAAAWKGRAPSAGSAASKSLGVLRRQTRPPGPWPALLWHQRRKSAAEPATKLATMQFLNSVLTIGRYSNQNPKKINLKTREKSARN